MAKKKAVDPERIPITVELGIDVEGALPPDVTRTAEGTWLYTGTRPEDAIPLFGDKKSVLMLPNTIYIAGTFGRCWACQEAIPLMVPFAPYAYYGYMEDGIPEVHFLNRPVEILDTAELPVELQRFFEASLPFFHKGYSRTAGRRYWANHCTHCGKIQGDYFLHSEPESPFWIEYPEDAERLIITKLEMANGYVFTGSYSFSEWDPIVLVHGELLSGQEFVDLLMDETDTEEE